MTDVSHDDVHVYLGLRACGCPVAVCVDRPEHRKDTKKTINEFLRDGLDIQRATWQEWQEIWMPKFRRECEHVTPNVNATQQPLPLGGRTEA